MNKEIMTLDAVSIKPNELVKLSSNIDEILYDCAGMDGATLKNEMVDRFPLAMWLMSTALSRSMRARTSRGLTNFHKNSDGKWVMDVPKSIWTDFPTDTKNDCCWVPFDFAKCGTDVPVNLLCLKDCDNILDNLVNEYRHISSQEAVPGLSSAGQTVKELKTKIAKLSMAFFTAHNIVLGLDNTYTDTLKPFHGLLQLINNDAVIKMDGTNILAAFDSLGCRLAVMGGAGDRVFALNDILYNSLLEVIVPDQNGRLPRGWTREGDTLKFRGIGFLRDKMVPVDMADGTGEIWMLDGDAVGVHMGTNLIPEASFIRSSGEYGGATTDSCGNECDYYYNFGAAFNNNANKLAVIADVPISDNCFSGLMGIAGLITPETLIPSGEVKSA